jgi:hypothetical protein
MIITSIAANGCVGVTNVISHCRPEIEFGSTVFQVVAGPKQSWDSGRRMLWRRKDIKFSCVICRNGIVIFPPVAMCHSSPSREDVGAAFGCAQSRPVMARHSVELGDIRER